MLQLTHLFAINKYYKVPGVGYIKLPNFFMFTLRQKIPYSNNLASILL